jgi:hypothetical protein
MALGSVGERLDKRVPFERLLDDAPLNPFTAPVNQPDLAKPRLVGGVHVFLDDRRDVFGVKSM